MSSRLIVVSFKKNKDREPLGHEIHLIRCAIVNMMTHGVISPKDILVTCRDRMFLYEELFDKVLPVEDSALLLFSGRYDMIDFTGHPHAGINGLPVDPWELGDSTGYFNPDFVKMCGRIRYMPEAIIPERGFVMIHLRYDAPLSYLERLVAGAPDHLEVVIFYHEPKKLAHLANRVVSNLQEYATLLHSPQCVMVISEWSGAGQLAQYCSDATIIYYVNKYTLDVHLRPPEVVSQHIRGGDDHYTNCMRMHEQLATQKRICDSWDFKTITRCERHYFPDIDHLIDKLPAFAELGLVAKQV